MAYTFALRPMLTPRRSSERGHADHGWLDAFHTFSFAEYMDPEFMGFETLRVLNQDRIGPAKGFGYHGHRDMEIVTYVLSGVLEHGDSMGTGSVIRPGEVQLMSAGRGVMHSEFNGSDEQDLHLLQMWVLPAERGGEPRYEQRPFAEAERRGRLRLVVSPDGAEGSLVIGQDARLYAGLLDGEERCSHALPASRAAWVHVAKGHLELNGIRLGPGDGAAVRDEPELTFTKGASAEFVMWELGE